MNPDHPTILINGRNVPVTGYPTQTTLLDFIRDLGLTGAKEGCAEGECGACTVLMLTANGNGSAYTPVNSCLMFLPAAAGREFHTVESLADKGKLCEVQQAMAKSGGSQCGYCTPGFVVSLFAEQYRPGRTGPCDPHSMSGNLCRCTGYRPIRDAALSLGPAPAGPFLRRLSEPTPKLPGVRYSSNNARFDQPDNLDECLSLALKHPGAKWVSGATDLGVESNLRFSRWPHLISLEAVEELQQFSETEDAVTIGAALPLSGIGKRWKDAPSAVKDWLPLFASLPIRNRATLGGNLATASPIGDSAPLLLALNASAQAIGKNGARTIPLHDFFTAYRQTRMEPGELIAAIVIPKPFPSFTRFYKGSKRRMDDISTVAAGLSLQRDSGGKVTSAAFAFGGVGPVSLRGYGAEQEAIGQPWNQGTLKRVQQALERDLHPIDDHRGSAAYRTELAKSLLAKFWFESQQEPTA